MTQAAKQAQTATPEDYDRVERFIKVIEKRLEKAEAVLKK